MHSSVALLLVSLVVSSQAGSYHSRSYAPKYAPPPPVIRHVVPAPVVHTVKVLPAPLPAPIIRTVEVLPAPLPVVPVVPHTVNSQFHSQDELGQASFGYSHPGQAAVTHRDANGNMAGSWSYINPEGKEVRVSYIADALGFRVISNDLPVAPLPLPAAVPVGPVALPAPLPVEVAPLPVGPVGPILDTPEVTEAKLAHFAAVAEAKARNGILSRGRRHAGYGGPSYSGRKSYYNKPAPVVRVVPQPIVHVAPAPVIVPAPLPAPVVLTAPIADVHKFHSQDELGQASFGFSTPDQTQTNFRDIHGNQVGSYSYINPEGKEIIVHYTAGKGGFQVVSNALPVAPAAVVLHDTPEVVAARNEHLALFNQALLRNH